MSQKVHNFRAGNVRAYLPAWKSLTSDNEILTTVSGLKIDIPEDTPTNITRSFQHNFNVKENLFISNEFVKLLAKGVIVENQHEPDEII